MDIGPAELIIILAIVVLIFGVGRLGKVGAELGTAIREFRQALHDDETKEAEPSHSDNAGQTQRMD